MGLKKLLIFNLILFFMALLSAGYLFIKIPKPMNTEKTEAVSNKITNSKDIEFLRKAALSLHALVVKDYQDMPFVFTLAQIGLIIISIGYAANVGYLFFLLKKK